MTTKPNQYSTTGIDELDPWKRQESTFCILHLVVLAVLLLVHTLFTAHFGVPSRTLVAVLAGAFLLRVLQLVWIQGVMSTPSRRWLLLLTGASILLNLALAFVAAILTDRSDSQYFVLLVMPVVEAAFRFGLAVTIGVILAAGVLNFLWIARYAQMHGSVMPNEYFEAGTISMIYAFVGMLVWILVNNLRANEAELGRNLLILRQTQEKLLREEKLAAVGRLSSAIAHEIRNPVAMISSSLATAIRGQLEPAQRERMFEIASVQAARLEKLTNDFLSYARPRTPALTRNNAADVLAYVAELSKAHAGERQVEIRVDFSTALFCDFDATLLQQALLNLVMNAIDASPPDSTVIMTGRVSGDAVCIDVKNTGTGIDSGVMDQIFEPFFTTKPTGTGLGLAIARNAARGHGGDITLTHNGPDVVTFTLTLPVRDKTITKAG
ncbi:MAG TPA: HAMP domain-containing sensor histidine kinase [Terriglobales bacterium]